MNSKIILAIFALLALVQAANLMSVSRNLELVKFCVRQLSSISDLNSLNSILNPYFLLANAHLSVGPGLLHGNLHFARQFAILLRNFKIQTII